MFLKSDKFLSELDTVSLLPRQGFQRATSVVLEASTISDPKNGRFGRRIPREGTRISSAAEGKNKIQFFFSKAHEAADENRNQSQH